MTDLTFYQRLKVYADCGMYVQLDPKDVLHMLKQLDAARDVAASTARVIASAEAANRSLRAAIIFAVFCAAIAATALIWGLAQHA